MKKNVFTFIFMSCLICLSCSNRIDIFEQALIYHSSKDNNHYFDLGIHGKTLAEMTDIYGAPSNNGEFRLDCFEQKNYEEGDYILRELAALFSNCDTIPPINISYYRWEITNEKDTWLQAYFLKDNINQQRVIYGEISSLKYLLWFEY